MGSTEETVGSKDTREVIMEATFRALSEHGYSDLRMRDIGEEMELTRQVIHYHFDGKRDLMSSFLEYVAEQYEGAIDVEEYDDPRAELEARIEQCLFGPGFDEFGHWERMKVYHELFAHAQNDEEHQAILDEHYDAIKDSIVRVVEDGIEAGVFRDVDAERMGQFITDAIHVGRERRLSLGHDDAPEETQAAIEAFVLDSLYVDDESGPA
ncbi:TetR/AcrR family transcriptional regulator [Halosimplex halobium]|uniref:TetR/AcrR family transcriptional regulator n=1 Tax=Halosimplex halobium TaxID=3396618 RepID=UPI003F550C3D